MPYVRGHALEDLIAASEKKSPRATTYFTPSNAPLPKMGVDDLISELVSEHATYVLCGLSRAERAVKWAELARQVEQNLQASIRYEEERLEQERLQEEEDAQRSPISGSRRRSR